MVKKLKKQSDAPIVKINNRCVGNYDSVGPIKCFNCLNKEKCLEVTRKYWDTQPEVTDHIQLSKQC